MEFMMKRLAKPNVGRDAPGAPLPLTPLPLPRCSVVAFVGSEKKRRAEGVAPYADSNHL